MSHDSFALSLRHNRHSAVDHAFRVPGMQEASHQGRHLGHCSMSTRILPGIRFWQPLGGGGVGSRAVLALQAFASRKSVATDDFFRAHTGPECQDMQTSLLISLHVLKRTSGPSSRGVLLLKM